jgi:hypothetical protein
MNLHIASDRFDSSALYIDKPEGILLAFGLAYGSTKLGTRFV